MNKIGAADHGTARLAIVDDGAPRSVLTKIIVCSAALIAFVGFIALGTWQVQRLSWKLDLIARTEARVHAAPVPAPTPSQWQSVSAKADEYRHVSLRGTYLPTHSVRVQAVTDYGAGFWLLTPLRQIDGSLVLVNRGFVLPLPSGPTDAALIAPCTNNPVDTGGSTAVTGLLRITEPNGAFLRHNDPRAQRWYSRDVQAIALQQGLGPVAPYFVDADASLGPAQPSPQPSSECPIGGLTVVSFQNNHLVYAATWYVLALMTAGAFGWSVRSVRAKSGVGRAQGSDEPTP